MSHLWRKSKKEERRYKPEKVLDGEGREHLILKLDFPGDAYSRFSPSEQRRISPEAWAYLTEENRHMTGLVIEVKNAEMAGNKELQEEFQKTLFEESRFENFIQYRKRQMNTVKAWIRLFVGILVIALGILLRTFGPEGAGLFFQTIDILAWVVIWEAFDAFIFVRSQLKQKYLFTYRIRTAKIVFIG